MSPPIRLLACLGLASFCVAPGCARSIENPDPPAGVTELEAEYLQPTGTLQEDSLADAAKMFLERVKLLESTGNLGLLHGLTDEVADPSNGLAKEDATLDTTEGARLLAVARLSYVCRGEEDNGVVDADRNGRASATGKGSNRGIFPVIWGEFSDCIDHTPMGTPFTIDGQYFVLLRKTDTGLSKLVWFDGSISADGIEHRGDLSFVLSADGKLELLIAVADGDVVIGAGAQGSLLRDRDDQWDCQLDQLQCESESTGEVISVEAETP